MLSTLYRAACKSWASSEPQWVRQWATYLDLQVPAQDFSGQLEPRPVWDLIQYKIVALLQFPWMVSFCIVSSSVMLTPGNHHRNNGPAQWTWCYRKAGNLKKCSVAAPLSDFFHLFVESVGKNFLLNPQWNRMLLQIPNERLSTNLFETAKQRGRLEAMIQAGLTTVHTGKDKEFTTCCTVSTIQIFLFVLYNFVSFWAMLCLYLCRTSSYWIKQ